MPRIIGSDLKASLMLISPGESQSAINLKLSQNIQAVWNRQNALENRILELEKRVG